MLNSMLVKFSDLGNAKAPVNDYSHYLALVDTLLRKFKEMNNVSLII